MKEILLYFVFLQLVFVYGAPKSQKRGTSAPSDKGFNGAVEQLVFPNGNSLLEIDIVKGYYPEVVQNIRKKRQAESTGEGESKKRSRRKKKKRRRSKSRGESSTTLGEVTPTRTDSLPPFEKKTDHPNLENVLEPSRSSRWESRSSAPPEPPVQKPELSEMRSSRDDNDGLLKVKSLHSGSINADSMKVNRLKADRIKADAISAKDVIVTAKRSGGGRRKSRRRGGRPEKAEFIEQGPIFEHVGSQRANSIFDQQQYATEPYYANPYGLSLGETVKEPRQPDIGAFDTFVRTRPSSRRSFQEQITTESFTNSYPHVIPEIAQPEYVSSRILSKTPILGEFIEGASRKSTPSQSFVRKPLVEKRPMDEFHLFDSSIAYRRRPQSLPTRVDKTSKTFVKNVDPWFL